MSAIRVQQIRACLEQQFRPQVLDITDDGAHHIGHAHEGGGHFSVHIVADAFTGLPRLARHRLVYDALDEMLHHGIHALSIRAQSPQETASSPST